MNFVNKSIEKKLKNIVFTLLYKIGFLNVSIRKRTISILLNKLKIRINVRITGPEKKGGHFVYTVAGKDKDGTTFIIKANLTSLGDIQNLIT